MQKFITTFVLGLICLAAVSQNVGIGTNNPSNKLQVVGIARADTIAIGTSAPRAPLSFAAELGQKIMLWEDGSVGSNGYGIGVQSGLMQLHTYSVQDDIAFGYGRSTSFTEKMRIKGNGNVGINTTTPQAKLTINGNVQIADGTQAAGKILTSDGSGFASWQNIPATASNWTASGNNIYNNNSGNIGIGNTNPSYKLHVGNANNSLRIEGPSASGTNGNAFSIGGYGSVAIDKPGVVGGRFTIKENGNVGIDNNNPVNKLDINGDVNFTGLLKINGNSGSAGQILMSNGNSSAATWVNKPYVIYFNQSGNVFITGNSTEAAIPGLDQQQFTLSQASRVVFTTHLYLQANVFGSPRTESITEIKNASLQVVGYADNQFQFHDYPGESVEFTGTTIPLPPGTYSIYVKTSRTSTIDGELESWTAGGCGCQGGQLILQVFPE